MDTWEPDGPIGVVKAEPPQPKERSGMRIIGLTGEARAGKDTVAQIIAAADDDEAVKVTGFAHGLKLSVARAFWGDELYFGPGEEYATELEAALAWCDWLKTQGEVACYNPKTGGVDAVLSGRAFLQNYGTEAHRDVFGEDFWLDAVLPMDASGTLDRRDCDTLVIADVRFPNEAERVLDCGGEVWRVVRPHHDNGAAVAAHASEQTIDEAYITRTIANDGPTNAWREVLEDKVSVAL